MLELKSNVDWYRGFHEFLLETPDFIEFAGMFGGTPVLNTDDADLIKLHQRAIGFLHYQLDEKGRQRFFRAITSYANRYDVDIPKMDRDYLPYLQSLNEEGWVQLPDIDKKTVVNLVDHFKNGPLLPWGVTSKDQYMKAADLRSKTNVATVPDEFLSNRPDILNLALSHEALSIAANHMQAPPILLGITAWTSFSAQDNPERRPLEAQKFHFDLSDYRFVKQFIYLTDVDMESGPHVYAAKTHRSGVILAARDKCVRDGLINEAEFNEWYFRTLRKEDCDVENYLNCAPVAITGKAGSRLMVNTEGIHKGLMPVAKDRWILQFLYGVSASMQIDTNNGLKFSRENFLAQNSSLARYSGQFLNIV